MKKILSLILTILFIAYLIGCSPVPNTQNNSDDDNEIISESAAKKTPEVITYETMTYFANDEDIWINAYFGCSYEKQEEIHSFPRFSDYEVNGYPFFAIIDTYEGNYKPFDNCIIPNPRENSCFEFYGNKGFYEKSFSRSEMDELNIDHEKLSQIYYKEWYSESIPINFVDGQVGEYGMIAIIYGWHYLTATHPYFVDENGCTTLFEEKFIYYYIGEDGIGFARHGWEKAKENLGNAQPLQPSTVSYAGEPVDP